MSTLDPMLWHELVESVHIDDEDMVTGAVLLLRTKDMSSGQTAICIGSTKDTDGITKYGLLHGAIDIVRGEWEQQDQAEE
jgi:hypothetical protein